jgi:hypothetical protein
MISEEGAEGEEEGRVHVNNRGYPTIWGFWV